MSRLTPEQRCEIVRRFDPGVVTMGALAQEYGVVTSTVSRLIKRAGGSGSRRADPRIAKAGCGRPNMRTTVRETLQELRLALYDHDRVARRVRRGASDVNERLIAYERVRVQAERLAHLLYQEERYAGAEMVLQDVPDTVGPAGGDSGG